MVRPGGAGSGALLVKWQPTCIAPLNGLVNKTAELAKAFHGGVSEHVPVLVMLTGVWLKLLESTVEQYVDKKGRKRDRLKKFPCW